MLMRIATGAALVLCLAAPSAPTEQEQVEQQKQAAEALSAKWAEAMNRGDSATAASLFASDAVLLSVSGKATGDEEIEAEAKQAHNMGLSVTTTVDDVKPLATGQMMLVTGTFQLSFSNNPATKTAQGNWLRLIEKEGSEWKILAQSFVRTNGGPKSRQ
jgi:uncharacterized protein (TIGR02246 family)